ncbi:hypothetical protein GCM10009648_34760 [Tsukamurella spumae]
MVLDALFCDQSTKIRPPRWSFAIDAVTSSGDSDSSCAAIACATFRAPCEEIAPGSGAYTCSPFEPLVTG